MASNDRRLEFQLILENLVNEGLPTPTRKVYFEPPNNLSVTYPCVIYTLNRYQTVYADNQLYHSKKCYTVTYVDRNPDASFPDLYLKSQPLTHFDREFTSDNLHHWVFTTYY